MNTLDVYDPAMCCSTGVCGPQVNPALVRFAADLKWLAAELVQVRRFNLAQTPAAFAESNTVRALLQDKGDAALPVLIANGEVVSTGRYPDRKELGSWFHLVDLSLPRIILSPATGDCCGGKC